MDIFLFFPEKKRERRRRKKIKKIPGVVGIITHSTPFGGTLG
jgi:hypothetical protein